MHWVRTSGFATGPSCFRSSWWSAVMMLARTPLTRDGAVAAGRQGENWSTASGGDVDGGGGGGGSGGGSPQVVQMAAEARAARPRVITTTASLPSSFIPPPRRT